MNCCRAARALFVMLSWGLVAQAAPVGTEEVEFKGETLHMVPGAQYFADQALERIRENNWTDSKLDRRARCLAVRGMVEAKGAEWRETLGMVPEYYLLKVQDDCEQSGLGKVSADELIQSGPEPLGPKAKAAGRAKAEVSADKARAEAEAAAAAFRRKKALEEAAARQAREEAAQAEQQRLCEALDLSKTLAGAAAKGADIISIGRRVDDAAFRLEVAVQPCWRDNEFEQRDCLELKKNWQREFKKGELSSVPFPLALGRYDFKKSVFPLEVPRRIRASSRLNFSKDGQPGRAPLLEPLGRTKAFKLTVADQAEARRLSKLDELPAVLLVRARGLRKRRPKLSRYDRRYYRNLKKLMRKAPGAMDEKVKRAVKRTFEGRIEMVDFDVVGFVVFDPESVAAPLASSHHLLEPGAIPDSQCVRLPNEVAVKAYQELTNGHTWIPGE